MKINALIAFLISCFLSAYFFILPVSYPVRFLVILLPLTFLAVFTLYGKLSVMKNPVFKSFIIVLTLIPYMAFAYYIFLCSISLPIQGPFEEKIKPVASTQEEYSAGKTFIALLDEFEADVNYDVSEKITNYDYKDAAVIEALNKTANKRIEIVNFLKSNNIAIPRWANTEDQSMNTVEYVNSMSLSPLVSFINLELTEVKKMQDEGKIEDAVDKYMNTWQTAETLLSAKSSALVDSLYFIAIVKKLCMYYYDNQNVLRSYDFSKIENTIKNIIPGLDKSFETGFTTECLFVKSSFSKFRYAWPLFDYYDSVRLNDNLYYSLIQFVQKPYSEENDLIEPIDPSKTNMYFVKNPISKVLHSVSASTFSGVALNIRKLKTEIGVYLFAINYRNNPQDLPLNYQTGEKLKINEHPDYLEVEVINESNSKSEIFKILK